MIFLLFLAVYSYNLSFIDTYLPFAAIAECGDSEHLKSWNCGFQCDQKPGVKVLKTFHSQKFEAFAFLARDGDELIVSFRGSGLRLSNWINDMRFGKQRLDGEAEVHYGFYKVFSSIWDEILVALNDHYSSKQRIVLTGHSLGGAMATIAAFYLRSSERIPNDKIMLLTFESPRVGNDVFSKIVSSLPFIVRVTQTIDMIPRLPPRSFGYLHTKGEYWLKTRDLLIDCSVEFENENCINSSFFSIVGSEHAIVRYTVMKCFDGKTLKMWDSEM